MNAWIAMLVPWIDALGRCLLHFIWQGALIGLAFCVFRPLCASVGARYRLGMGALLAMLACPLGTLFWLQPGADIALGPVTDVSATTLLTGAITARASQLTSTWHWQQALPWFVGVWLIGVSIIATRSFLHWRRLTRIVRHAVALPREWQLSLIQLRMRFGILRPVSLLSSMHIATPTLIGWLKPAILLPASLLSGFTPAQIELIIAHELSHVRRFDYIANLAQVAIETLLFYHPVVHWISRDVRQARESCCDDLVLTLGGGNAVAYARTLADLEELHHHGFGTAVPALGAGGGVLFARIRRIVDPMHTFAVEPLPRSNGLTLPVLLTTAGLALAMLRMHPLPPTVADALVRNSVQSAALFGNTAWMAPRMFTPSASNNAPPPVETMQAQKPAPNADYIIDQPARPRIAFAAPRVDRSHVADLTAHIALPAPPLVAMPDAATDSVAPNASASQEHAPVAAIAGPIPDQVVQPRYPLEALQAGTTGKVDLDFRIASDGSVRDIRVLHAQPSGVFEQTSIAALKQWHFAPAAGADGKRYTRSFAFARADTPVENCREVTGSHICRRATSENGDN